MKKDILSYEYTFENSKINRGPGGGGGFWISRETLAYSGKDVSFLCNDFALVLSWSGTLGRAWMTLPREAWTESAAFSGSYKEKQRGE